MWLPGEGSWLDPAAHDPLNAGGGVGVARLAHQAHRLVDAPVLRARDLHRVRGNWNTNKFNDQARDCKQIVSYCMSRK